MGTQPYTADRAGLALAGRAWALAAAAVFFVAAYYGVVSLALLAGASLVLAGLARLSAWLSTWRVTYARSLTSNRAFPGDTLVLRVCLANPKPLPVPWLEVVENLPPALASATPGGARRLLHLPWRSAAYWEYALACRRRGAYRLGAVELRGGDPYGLATRAITLAAEDEVLVYPRLLPLAALGLPARAIFGRQRPPHSLNEDPSRLGGLRDYAPGDPFNRIHWKATARQGRLQVKVYEPTTTPKAILVLAVEEFAGSSQAEANGEWALSVLASLAHEGAQLGWAVGVFANGSPPLALGPGAGRAEMAAILEGLARLALRPELPLPALLAAERPLIPAGSTIVFVTASPGEDLLAAAQQLAAAGHAVAFVTVGRASPPPGNWPAFAVAAEGDTL